MKMLQRMAPVALILTFSLLAAPARADDAFPALAYLQLTPKTKPARPFPWPATERFKEAWQRAENTRLIRVLDATWASSKGPVRVLLAAHPSESGYRLYVIDLAGDRSAYYQAQAFFHGDEAWTLEASESVVRIRRGDASTELAAHRFSPAGSPSPRGPWTDWTYLAVLLDTRAAEPGEFEIPMGRCSMDTAPQAAARSHAETCFQAGRIGCFLEFQLRIMGDYFDRVAWSSYGERVHMTQSDRLLATGLDLDRLFRGLIAQFASDKRRRFELGGWRLGRALAELGDARPLTAIRAMAANAEVDEYNRLRAAITLFNAKIAALRAKEAEISIAAVANEVRTEVPALSWSSIRWLELQQ